MGKMKKIISLTIATLMIVFAVIGCSADNEQQSAEPTGTVISNSEQQNIESTPTGTPSASVSPTPSASPSVSSSPSPTARTSKAGNRVNGKDGKNGTNGQDGADGQNGADGQDGADGSDGQTPYIGSNGNWWIGNTDTGVSATGQGTSGSVGTPIADIAVGTKFPCYPNKEFDWVTDDGITVHISSIDIELTDKESYSDITWEEWAANPELRRERQQYQRTDYKYTISCKITGYTDPSLSGYKIVLSCFGIEDGIGANAIIDANGNFSAVGGRTYWQTPIDTSEIMFEYAFIYNQPTPTPEPPVIADVDAFIDVAKAQLGKPYVLGGKGDDSFDTSGFIYYVLKQSGSDVGYMTSGGWASSSYPTVNSMNDLQRGDIICMTGRMGIYLGNNQMIEASQSQGKVVVVTIDDDIKNNFLCGKRLHAGTNAVSQQSIKNDVAEIQNPAPEVATIPPTQTPTTTAVPNETEAPTSMESPTASASQSE